MKTYKTETWLNPKESSNTGAIVCFSGAKSYKPSERTHYVEIQDCQQKVTIHDTLNRRPVLIKKLKLMVEELNKFIAHLEAAHAARP